MTAPLDLFAQDTPPMTRANDHATSVAAADRVRTVLSELQQAVLIAIASAGLSGLTDREIERLPQFAELAPSTCRKRRSELLHATPPRVRALREPSGKIVERDGLTVWVAV